MGRGAFCITLYLVFGWPVFFFFSPHCACQISSLLLIIARLLFAGFFFLVLFYYFSACATHVDTCVLICAPVHMLAEASGSHQMSCSVTPHLILLRQALSLNLEIFNFVRLTVQQVLEILLVLIPQCWDYRCMPLCLIFFKMWVLEDQTQVLRLVQHLLYWLRSAQP